MVAINNLPPSPTACASHEIPERFYCPISLDVMADPVITEHGQRFDRRWIVAIIAAGEPCPLTRQPFKTRALTPDRELKHAIMAHPSAQKAACDATQERLPGTRDSFNPDSTRHAVSIPWADHSDPSTFMLGNIAGRAHCRLSRHNLRGKIATAQNALQLQELQNGPVDDRAQLAGRIKRLQMLLLVGNAAAPVTRSVDFVLGTYKHHEGSPRTPSQGGIVGEVGMAATLFSCGIALPGASLVGQSASLLGASIKGGVRLAAQAPAKVVQVAARRAYILNAS